MRTLLVTLALAFLAKRLEIPARFSSLGIERRCLILALVGPLVILSLLIVGRVPWLFMFGMYGKSMSFSSEMIKTFLALQSSLWWTSSQVTFLQRVSLPGAVLGIPCPERVLKLLDKTFFE